MDIAKIEKILTWIMVGTAALGTIWYIYIDWQAKGELSAVGWSLVAVVWFVIYRRLMYQWRTKQKNAQQNTADSNQQQE